MAQQPPSLATTNHLVNRLSRSSRNLFSGACEEVNLAFEQVIVEQGHPLDYVYFPLSGYVSQISKSSGRSLEVAITGNEGMFGLPAALGVRNSQVLGIVQGAGRALRMKAGQFRQCLGNSKQLSGQLDLFTAVSLTQLVITAECSRFHTIDQRLARWLLVTADRAHSGKFRVTHEFLAYMLGSRRVGITMAASKLQREGVVRYSRGDVDILDFARLRRVSCACYENGVTAYDAAFGNSPGLRTSESSRNGRTVIART